VGKTTLARILAKCLNCETGVTPEPCGECSACKQIDAGRFVDLLELDAASNTGVDNMREVLDNAQYAPTVGRYKVYIIDEVHMLSKPAFNSMLKTLEEPPEHVKFILATTDPQKIPVTVLSRCLQFNLKPMTPPQVVQRLAHVLGEEGIAADAGALKLLSRAANGSMRDALSLTDQAIAHGSGRLEAAAVEAMLGTVGQEYLFDILDALSRQDADALLAQPRLLAERGLSLSAALQDLGSLLTQIALAQVAPGAIAEDGQDAARVQEYAQKIDAESVQLYYQIALNGRRDLPFAPDELSGFSMTLLRMLAFTLGTDVARQPVAARPAALAVPKAQIAQTVAEKPQAVLAAEPSPVPPSPLAPQSAAPVQIQSGQDWPAIVADLKLGGMARMLADQCELKSFDGSAMYLGLADAHKHLLDKIYQEKLEAALRQKFGAQLKVKFEVGAVSGQSPVEVRARAKAEKQAEAVAAIETDPFIRDLVEQFDARIDPASIQPLGEKQ
jgi:DNA polymerase-3 subunit gamma/tau